MIELSITVRKAADIVSMPVSTLYYRCIKEQQDRVLADMIKEIAFKHTFYGYRRIHLVMRRRGICVNHKRVYRIYKSLNLQRQKNSKKKRKVFMSKALTEANYCNHVWAVDFLFDTLVDGRSIKILTIEDVFSRFSIGIEVGFSIHCKVVVEVMEKCIRLYGIPKVIRTDQGPEFISSVFKKFVGRYRICHKFIEKGSPWQNGAVESFNGKLREECLNRNLFENQVHAKAVLEVHRNFYNTERPHSSLGGRTPLEVFNVSR